MQTPTKIFIAACIFICLNMAFLYSAPRFMQNGEFDIIPYDIKLKSMKGTIECLVVEDTTYIPLLYFLLSNKIFTETRDMKLFKGFFINPEDKFTIDLNTLSASIKDKKVQIDENKVIATELEIYIYPEFFDELFGIPINANYSKLLVVVGDEAKIPILTQKEKKMDLEKKKRPSYSGDFPELSKNKITLIDGGRLDYRIYARQNNSNSRNYNVDANLGMVLLNGDFKYSILSDYDEKNNTFSYDNRFSLVYNFNNKYLSNVNLGSLYNNSPFINNKGGGTIPSQQIEGIRISNYNSAEQNLRNLTYNGLTEPLWSIELYNENKLVDMVTADTSGKYQFMLPASQGYHNYSIRELGHRGELLLKEEEYFINQYFIEPGKFKYSLNAGRTFFFKDYITDAIISAGLTNNLNMNVRYQENYTSSKRYLQGQINANYKKIQTSINYLHGLSIGAFVQYNYEKSFGLNLNYIKNLEDNNSINYIRQSLAGYFNYKTEIGIPINFRLKTYLQDYYDRVIFRFNTQMTFKFDRSYFKVQYGDDYTYARSSNIHMNDYQSVINLSAGYSFSTKDSSLSFLNGLGFSASGYYNLETRQIVDIGGSVRIPINRTLNLTCTYYRNLMNNQDRLQGALSLNLPYFSSITNASYTEGNDADFTQNIRGTMEFNSNNFNFDFSNNYRANTSAGGAEIYLFIDSNFNKKKDDNEKIIEDPKIKFESIRKFKFDKGRIIASSLPAFVKQNAIIQSASISNPFILASLNDFSFTTSPNSIKKIEIPCYTSASLEGNIVKVKNGKETKQDRIRVHIVSVDSKFHQIASVFSDGLFYITDVPAGNYLVYVDSVQAKMLKATPNPLFHELTIPINENGSEIKDLNFRLEVAPYKETLAKAEVHEINIDGVSKIIKQSDSYLLMENPLDWRSHLLYIDLIAIKLANNPKLNLTVDINSGLGIDEQNAKKLINELSIYFKNKQISGERLKIEYFKSESKNPATLEINVIEKK